MTRRYMCGQYHFSTSNKKGYRLGLSMITSGYFNIDSLQIPQIGWYYSSYIRQNKLE